MNRNLTILLTYTALFSVAVPWYWQWLGSLSEKIVVGVPLWVAVSILSALGIALHTAWVLREPWPGEEEPS